MKEENITSGAEERIVTKLTSVINALATQMDKRFVTVDERFVSIDERFDQVDRRFTEMDKRLTNVGKTLDNVVGTVDRVVGKLVMVEEKVDQMITKAEFNEFKNEYYSGQDQVVKMLTRLDQEQTFSNHRQGRFEKEISEIKLHLALA